MKKNTVTSKVKNREMNSAVYALRRQVIGLIYEAKKLADIPRITVRVAEDHSKILGVAAMEANIIWITEGMVASRAVVFHEILHAVYGQKHVDSCPLMAPAIDPNLSDALCNQLFKQYAEGKE